MQVNNPICLNDWKFRRFLIVVISLQIAVVGLNVMESLGIHSFGMQGIIGFLYLTFIPGFLILRSLRIHNLSLSKSLFYAVGLSIASIMFMGLLISIFLPLFGVSYPLTTTKLTIGIVVMTFLLIIISYFRDKDFFAYRIIDIPRSYGASVLVLTLLPIISALGATVMNQYGANQLIILLLLTIFIIGILIGFGRLIPKSLFPFAILTMSIALMFHRSLISTYIVGADIQLEYYLSNIVSTTASWNFNFHSSLTSLSDVNSMLSVVILAPTYSSICGISLIWVLKIIYPLLFAIVPVALFLYVKNQTSDDIAFFSAFFFISLFVFFGGMFQLARQEIAEVFLALIILLLVDKQTNPWAKRFLIMIFLYSLVVSHYGVTYVFLFMMAFGLFWLWLSKFKILAKIRISPLVKSIKGENLNILNYVALAIFGIVALSWYSYTAYSSNLEGLKVFFDGMLKALTYDLFNSWTTQGQVLITSSHGSLLHDMMVYVQLLMQLFIIVGFIRVFWQRDKYDFRTEYLALSLSALILLAIALLIPFASTALGVERTFQISLIFLAPFCIIGGLTIFQLIVRLVNRKVNARATAIKLLALLLSIFFVFNTSLVYYAAGEGNSSISLSNSMDGARFFTPEIVGMTWANHLPTETSILADSDRSFLVYGMYPNQVLVWRFDSQAMTNNSIIFLGKGNIDHHGIITIEMKGGIMLSSSYINYERFVDNRDLIYFNNQAKIYR